MNLSPRIFVKLLLAIALIVSAVLMGCDKKEAPGTPENLKADYERVVVENEKLKADFEKQKQEIDRTWKQTVMEKEQKITDLTLENASLRQRLLTVESALDETPLVDSARNRSVMWLHFTYILIILCFFVLLAVLLWVHANMRERARMFILQQAKLVRNREVINVEK